MEKKAYTLPFWRIAVPMTCACLGPVRSATVDQTCVVMGQSGKAVLAFVQASGHWTKESIDKAIDRLPGQTPAQKQAKKTITAYLGESLLLQAHRKHNAWTSEEMGALLVMLAQNAYTRAEGKERCELVSTKASKDLVSAAESLGLIETLTVPDYVITEHNNIKAYVVLGASFKTMLLRLATYGHVLTSLPATERKKGIYLLAGDRPAWVEIDACAPTFGTTCRQAFVSGTMKKMLKAYAAPEDREAKVFTKKFLLKLAQKQGLKVGNPAFIQRGGRTVLNYNPALKPGQKSVDETSLAHASASIVCPEIPIKHIVHTKTKHGENRPTTQTTAKDFAELFWRHVLEKKGTHPPSSGFKASEPLYVLAFSSQPYGLRQRMTLEHELWHAWHNRFPDKACPVRVLVCAAPLGLDKTLQAHVLTNEGAALLMESFKAAQAQGRLTRTIAPEMLLKNAKPHKAHQAPGIQKKADTPRAPSAPPSPNLNA